MADGFARKPPVYGDGNQVRDLVHVDNIAAGIMVPWQSGHDGPPIVGIPAARALGYRPEYDLKAGIATVWPEFAEKAK